MAQFISLQIFILFSCHARMAAYSPGVWQNSGGSVVECTNIKPAEQQILHHIIASPLLALNSVITSD